MTEYPVQCYNNNGEPYGRYVNPYNPNPSSINVKGSGDPDFASIVQHNALQFDAFAESNTFPMPGAEIGKTYQRDEVEVGWQAWEFDWVDATLTIDQYKSIGFDTRQIFRLIPQPVEKEPETVEPQLSSRQFIEQVYGTSTFARSIECKDAESLMDMMDDFLDWAMQKKQEASQ